MIREEDLEELRNLQEELQSRIDKASEDGRVFMMQQYVLLHASVTSQVQRIQARFHRETKAANRKAAKELKASQKGAKDHV
jgi:hypothetical protein